MCSVTTDAGVSCWFMASSVVGSTPCATTIFPSGAASAAAGSATARASAIVVRQTRMRTPPHEREMDAVRTAPTLGFARQRVKVRERVLPRLHPSEVLGLAQPREEPADRRAGRQSEPRHDVLTSEERRGRADGVLLWEAAEEVAEQAGAAP